MVGSKGGFRGGGGGWAGRGEAGYKKHTKRLFPAPERGSQSLQDLDSEKRADPGLVCHKNIANSTNQLPHKTAKQQSITAANIIVTSQHNFLTHQLIYHQEFLNSVAAV